VSPPSGNATSGGGAGVARDTSTQGRFVTGAIVAGRYRIIGLIGEGGMGEVYRADDMKLGQAVALKFLPESLERDESRLQRFLNEVKIARQVSHANVCRVYDVGEVGGQHYLSMEYVDGEDLASLLRRIGRLPGDKAAQIARQICAGLAAAHRLGIVHRDLKPSNVMIDGRGQARITDFGLAGWAEGFSGAEIRVGTPAYMSPEQLSGQEVTPQSDIYSLGLVLYELFTGKAAFEAPTIAEITKRHQETTPTIPSTLVPDLDPAVERVILLCLEKDPRSRPSSPLAVAAALPGGDPLAAALAAGETPSPEMVAAAGPEGGLRPGVAFACAAIVIAGLLVATLLLGKAALYELTPMDRPVAAMTDDARNVIAELDYTDPPADHVTRLSASLSSLQYLARQDRTATRWDPLASPGQRTLYVFYRQSPEPMTPLNLSHQVTGSDPNPVPGDISLRLGLDGRLLRFRAIPPAVERDRAPAGPTDWSKLFDAARLDINAFEETAPTLQPRVFADTRMAWSGLLPDRGNMPARVEAASLGGKVVFFDTVTPDDSRWSEESEAAATTPPGAQRAAVVLLGLAGVIIAGAIFLVIRNLRRGRGDLKGAMRLAIYVAVLSLLYWVITGHHVAGTGEILALAVALGNALSLGLLSWIGYIAIEPYARRLWPQALVSWTRLLSGRLRDPLVGRDVLFGLGFGAGLLLIQLLSNLTPKWLGLPPALPVIWGVSALPGGRWAVGPIFLVPLVSLSAPLVHFVILLLLRIVLRRTWIAAIAYVGLVALTSGAQGLALSGGGLSPGLILVFMFAGALTASLLLTVLLRFGLLATATCFLLVNLVASYPLTFDTSAPYFVTGLIGILVIVALMITALRIALAGQTVFTDSLLDT
jgi:serine/threonine-protein kinase